MIRISVLSLTLMLLLSAPTLSLAKTAVAIETNLGRILLELDEERAPITVQNFLNYAEKGFYEGLIFHRVIPGFMIQGGGLNASLERKVTESPIKNEGNNGLKNVRGSIAMARTRAVDSATSQFFINLSDNGFLDTQPGRPGYAVFGQVIGGMEVVDAIAAVETGSSGSFNDVPTQTIEIRSISLVPPETEPSSEQ